MIGKLTGTFGGLTPGGAALIEVHGVGYAVRVPQNVLEELNPSTSLRANSAVSLFVHTAVREDAIDLYGFASDEELLFFSLLIGVSGIGPKSALGILNVADVATLKRSIARGDASALTKVFGIGKKSAERIVVELRDKLTKEIGLSPSASGAKSPDDFEVVEALIALGYSAHEARGAVKAITEPSMLGISERVAAALRQLGKA